MFCRHQANYFKVNLRATITDSRSHKMASRTDSMLGCWDPACRVLWQIIKNHAYLWPCPFTMWLCHFSLQEVTLPSPPLEYGLILWLVFITRMGQTHIPWARLVQHNEYFLNPGLPESPTSPHSNLLSLQLFKGVISFTTLHCKRICCLSCI